MIPTKKWVINATGILGYNRDTVDCVLDGRSIYDERCREDDWQSD